LEPTERSRTIRRAVKLLMIARDSDRHCLHSILNINMYFYLHRSRAKYIQACVGLHVQIYIAYEYMNLYMNNYTYIRSKILISH